MPPPAPGSAALFIDWENFKYSLYEVSRMPNIPALVQAVEQRYGRPTIMRAYADWQDYYHRRSWDQMSLYQAGIDPVYVPARHSPFGQERIKNSVDVRMSLDCLEVAFTHPGIETFVLVAGDADFLHAAAALRRRGVKVVMIGVSSSTSGRLANIADEIVLYDEEIDCTEAEPPLKPETVSAARPALPPLTSSLDPTADAPSFPFEQKVSPEPLPKIGQAAGGEAAAQSHLLRLLREQREAEGAGNYPPLLSWLKLQMRDRAPRLGLEKQTQEDFKGLIAAMQAQDLLLVETQGMVSRVWLAEDKKLAQDREPPARPLPPHLASALAEPDDIPPALRLDFADIVLTAVDIENSYRDYMAKGLLGRFLYNKGHWNPADLPPQAAPPRSDGWRHRELPEIHSFIEAALDHGVLRHSAYTDSYSGVEIPTLELDAAHPFVAKIRAEEQIRS